jgi:hypothetical protein
MNPDSSGYMQQLFLQESHFILTRHTSCLLLFAESQKVYHHWQPHELICVLHPMLDLDHVWEYTTIPVHVV